LPIPAAAPSRHRHLRSALDAHDHARRAAFEGVTDAELACEHAHWDAVGAAVAGVAEMIRRRCAASAFCASPPEAGALAVRITEAIDDQLDEAAWRVVDAAAQWHAEMMRRAPG
jgi:hypothetical protein